MIKFIYYLRIIRPLNLVMIALFMWVMYEFIIVEHFEAIARSEEHTSELQSHVRISYAVFCLKKKKKKKHKTKKKKKTTTKTTNKKKQPTFTTKCAIDDMQAQVGKCKYETYREQSI